MKILVINGSPKGARSNTLQLTNAFLEGICEAQQNALPQIETLHISQMDIKSCQGCFSCWKTTPGQCVIKDDMSFILEKLLWADITIWSFPLYYYSLPGMLKMLIDRQLPLSLPFMTKNVAGGSHPARYDMGQKKTVLISTCGFYTSQTNYESVTCQFDKICGKGNYTTLFCGQGELFDIPELSDRTQSYLALVRQAGKEFARNQISSQTAEKLKELLFPREIFEQMADASWGVTKSGEKQDDALTFTKQMAALYDPASYKGYDIVFDMDYTDLQKQYRIILGKKESTVTEAFTGKAQTIIHTPFHVWKSIAANEIEGSKALMDHLYTVEGDFDLMLHWDDYFGVHEPSAIQEEKTNMAHVLIPWMAFWILASLFPVYGSSFTLLICGFLPIMFYKTRKTIYDVLSCALVSFLSWFMLMGIPSLCVIPLSYFAFGSLWTISAFLKIPLTAWYSMNEYGQEAAFRNPIFLKTNRILSAAWGILYLLTAIGTYFMMLTNAGWLITVINSMLPILMGVFTGWFQKWYPAHIARK